MEASKAEEIATSPDELQDLQDDLVIHQQTEPEPEPELEDELTNDIEKDPPKQPKPKRPRTKKHARGVVARDVSVTIVCGAGVAL